MSKIVDIDFNLFDTEIQEWINPLKPAIANAFDEKSDANLIKWYKAFKNLPQNGQSDLSINDDIICVGKELEGAFQDNLKETLQEFIPWRKGPFNICGIDIDSEWRSNLKWNRLIAEIKPLKDKSILDVGCGNGYYIYRMVDAGAKSIVGVDPFLLNVLQFYVVKNFSTSIPAVVLPVGIDDVLKKRELFDTVFSMGVIYHRRSPIDHLQDLKSLLKLNGELVLETLIVDGKEGFTLMPKNRYAKMRNVWFIPSLLTLESWLKRVGFKNVRCIHKSVTTTEEQRATDWMKFESLSDFLNPETKLTVEGYPLPQRAVFLAEK